MIHLFASWSICYLQKSRKFPAGRKKVIYSISLVHGLFGLLPSLWYINGHGDNRISKQWSNLSTLIYRPYCHLILRSKEGLGWHYQHLKVVAALMPIQSYVFTGSCWLRLDTGWEPKPSFHSGCLCSENRKHYWLAVYSALGTQPQPGCPLKGCERRWILLWASLISSNWVFWSQWVNDWLGSLPESSHRLPKYWNGPSNKHVSLQVCLFYLSPYVHLDGHQDLSKGGLKRRIGSNSGPQKQDNFSRGPGCTTVLSDMAV